MEFLQELCKEINNEIFGSINSKDISYIHPMRYLELTYRRQLSENILNNATTILLLDYCHDWIWVVVNKIDF